MSNKKASFYMNLIVILDVLTKLAASDDGVYLLATALYGTDPRGRLLVARGPLPPLLEDIIKADMRSRIHPDAIVKIVPIFKNITDLPLEVDRNKILQQISSYTNVLKVDLTEVKSRKMLEKIWYYVEEYEKYKYKPEVKDQQKEPITELPETTTEKRTPTQDDYVPNDIYYAVEKKCANWADGCDSKSPSILEMSSKHFKIPTVFRKPPLKLRWNP